MATVQLSTVRQEILLLLFDNVALTKRQILERKPILIYSSNIVAILKRMLNIHLLVAEKRQFEQGVHHWYSLSIAAREMVQLHYDELVRLSRQRERDRISRGVLKFIDEPPLAIEWSQFLTRARINSKQSAENPQVIW